MQHKFKNIIFDLDGTLFQTDKLVIPAFNDTFAQLIDEGFDIKGVPSSEKLLSIIGLPYNKVWKYLLPDTSDQIYYKASEYLTDNEIKSLHSGHGNLYSNVLETLSKLKELGTNLYIASNGQEEYVKEVVSTFRIKHFFEGIYSAGEFNTSSKDELVKLLLNDNNIEYAIMVGDRLSDIKAGKFNNLITVGCTYGYSSNNEFKEADYLINTFDQIIDIFEDVNKKILKSR